MIALLKYWQLVAGFIAASGVWLLILNWDISRLENKHKQALIKQIITDRELCESVKRITSKSESYYEAEILKRDADIKRLSNRPAKCIPIAKPANERNATNVQDKPDQPNGIPLANLLDYASECETDRIKVITLQGFIIDERQIKQ